MAESGKIILGRVQPRHLGQWDAARGYTVLDQVSYAGELWQCVAATTPGTAPTAANSAWWAKLSADATSVEALEQALAGKADASDLATVREELGDKADASELAEVKAGLDGKVDKTSGYHAVIQQNLDLSNPPHDVDTFVGWPNVYDKNGKLLGYMHIGQMHTGESYAQLTTKAEKADGSFAANSIILYARADGVCYAVSPPPREKAYANDIDTLRSSINRHPIKISGSKNFYVGGDNASDTADLFMGRGESAAMPFATLEACINFVRANYCGDIVYIQILSDMTIDKTLYMGSANINRFILRSANTSSPVTLTLNAPLHASYGDVILSDMNVALNPGGYILASGIWNKVHLRIADAHFTLNNAGMALNARGDSFIVLESNISFNGSVANQVVAPDTGATVNFARNTTVTGSVTGKRYACTYGGRIITNGKGPDFIPGTIAGTCDESSVYA